MPQNTRQWIIHRARLAKLYNHHPDSAIALVDALSIEPHPSLSGEHHDFTLHDQHP
jgi:hypothetical protein